MSDRLRRDRGALPTLEWHPIATAPQDGSEFIGWNGHRVYVLAWDVDHWDVRGGPLQILRLHPATHWLPLPVVDAAPGPTPVIGRAASPTRGRRE